MSRFLWFSVYITKQVRVSRVHVPCDAIEQHAYIAVVYDRTKKMKYCSTSC